MTLEFHEGAVRCRYRGESSFWRAARRAACAPQTESRRRPVCFHESVFMIAKIGEAPIGSPAPEHPLDILRDDVELDVEKIAGLQGSKIRLLPRVGNDPDGEAFLEQFGDR
jgi:hypothetical protein